MLSLIKVSDQNRKVRIGDDSQSRVYHIIMKTQVQIPSTHIREARHGSQQAPVISILQQ